MRALWHVGERAAAIEAMQACVDYEVAVGHPDARADAAEVAALREELGSQRREGDFGSV